MSLKSEKAIVDISTPATCGGDLCPVCFSKVRAAIDVDVFQLYHCAECDCWCSDALVREASTSFVPEHYFANPLADRPKWDRLLDNRRRSGLSIGSVLDVGCGTGVFLSFMHEHTDASRLAGIELDATRAKLAQTANPTATIYSGDAVTMARTLTDQYDLITLWDVFEHVPEPFELLEALSRRLAPGGWIFIQTIHENSLVPTLGRISYRATAGLFTALVRRTHEAHHLVFFSRRGIASLAKSSGLQCRDTWHERLVRSRMDGAQLITAATAMLMAIENLWANGLFINVILEAVDQRGSG